MDSLFQERFDRIKRATVKGIKNFFEGVENCGEILSYVIMTCEPVREFIAEQFATYRSNGCQLEDSDIDRAAGLIVGRVQNPKSEQFLADIINGPFDADKLDYLPRDCYFSGIRAEINVERIVLGLDWIQHQAFNRVLSIDAAVVPQLQQLLFGKMVLYSSLYHHHKVRTLECMVKAVFEVLKEPTQTVQHPIMKFESIIDFLRINEFQFLTWGLEEPCVANQLKNITNRQLLKRALVINRQTVGPNSRMRVSDIRSKIPNEAIMKEVRAKIFSQIPSRYQTTLGDFWLDTPKGPDVNKEAEQCWISYPGQDDPARLNESFPWIDDWVETYEANTLNNHAFYCPEIVYRRQAAQATCDYLKEEHGIEVIQGAWDSSHI